MPSIKNGIQSSAFKQNDLVQDFNTSDSQIAKFYEGRSVLVTGVSGFVGKLIIEKLLRTCTGLGNIFVLIRSKKNKPAQERLNDLLESTIFDELRISCKRDNSSRSFEQLRSKVIVLDGSLEQPSFGQSDERLAQLVDEVSVVIHSAAVLSFLGKLKQSVDTNLAGTHNMLELACKLPKLAAFIYVSTCYSNCARKSVDEQIYPVNIDPKTLIDLSKNLDEAKLETMRGALIGKHPNNYTYTKQLAEYLCGQYTVGPQQLPVLICRPSIIVPTCEEPIRGFVDNRNGGNGFVDGISRGIVRVGQGKHNVTMDIVPADFVSNCVISLAWFADIYHKVRRGLNSPSSAEKANTGVDKKDAIDDELEQKMTKYYLDRQERIKPPAVEEGLPEELVQVPVVHVASGSENPATCDRMAEIFNPLVAKYPSMALFRKPGITRMTNYYLHLVVVLYEVLIIAPAMDLFCKPPKLRLASGKTITSSWFNQFLRCYGLMSVVNYFVQRTFEFNTKSTRILIDEFMNNKDKKLFNCDVGKLDWDSYSLDMVLGARRYLFGEPDETLPEARRRYKWSVRRNTLIQAVTMALLSYMAYKFFW